jgi:hypothetical protein
MPPSYTYTQDAPYRDDPPTFTTSHSQTPQYQPYTDSPPATPTTNFSDDNIPLAHLLLNSYPSEAPPSYSVATRHTHSNRDTLIQYIPNREQRPRPVVIEIDEESGEVVSRTDDVRHAVEKVVAMFVVAALLLVLSAVLMWLAIGSGFLDT